MPYGKSTLFILIVYLICISTIRQFVKPICLEIPAKEVSKCCKFPKYSAAHYNAKCGHYRGQHSMVFTQLKFHPCAVSCIFHEAGAMNANYSLNMKNISTALNFILSDESFRIAYWNGFKACAPIVQAKIEQRLKRIRRRQRQGRDPFLIPGNCSRLPLMYAFCAHAEAFINCPTKYWTESEQCERAKLFLSECMDTNDFI